MRQAEDANIREIISYEFLEHFNEERDKIRESAKKQIQSVQDENRRTFNRKRKKAHIYKIGDLVAIKRTQFGSGLKLRGKFLGPYKVTSVKGSERYDVVKIGDDHEGPKKTSSCTEYMKQWSSAIDQESSESDEDQDGRM